MLTRRRSFSETTRPAKTLVPRASPRSGQVGSGSMTMAPHGHSATQIPQPLQ